MIILNLVFLSLKGHFYGNEVFWFELIFETPVASGVAGRTNVEICQPSSFFQQIESVPIQLAQCRFPGLAVSNAEILVYFWKITIRMQFYQTALGKCYVSQLPKC